MKKLYFCLVSLLFCFSDIAKSADLLPDIPIAKTGQHVVINIPQARLFLFKDGELTTVYGTGAGKPKTPTPLGEYHITEKRNKPTWFIPESIQKERNDGLKFIKYGEPGHPLGPVFVRFGAPKLGLGIHGTSAPSSIGKWPSHGCVRLKNENAIKFSQTISIGSPVSVIHQRYSLNQDEDGQLWVAVYPNIYGVSDDYTKELIAAIDHWLEKNETLVDADMVRNRIQDLCLTCSNKSKKQTRAKCLTCIGKVKTHKVSGSLKSLSWTEGSSDIRLSEDITPSQENYDQLFELDDEEDWIKTVPETDNVINQQPQESLF